MKNSNDHSHFLKWYQPIHAQFTRYCSSRAYGWMETEDLVQESVLSTLEAFYRIEDKQKLLSYMIGVANNICKNRHRRAKFKAEWREELLEKMESRIGDPELALDICDLHEAIDQLPEYQKQALLLFEISGFRIKEISKIQETTEGAVKTRLSRARKKLQHLLNEEALPSKTKSLTQRLAVYASLF